MRTIILFTVSIVWLLWSGTSFCDVRSQPLVTPGPKQTPDLVYQYLVKLCSTFIKINPKYAPATILKPVESSWVSMI